MKTYDTENILAISETDRLFDLAEEWAVSTKPIWFASRKGTESQNGIWLSEKHFGRHRYNRNGGRKPRRTFGRKARRYGIVPPLVDEFASYEERFID